MSDLSSPSKPPLRILLASPRGFCAGVDRAIQIGSQDASTNASSAQFNANQQNAWNLAQQQMDKAHGVSGYWVRWSTDLTRCGA